MTGRPTPEPPAETVEFEPFIPGREVRTFTDRQWDLLLGALRPSVSPRTMAAARLVLVDRMPYKFAAIARRESPSMVRGAVMNVMDRLGCMGAKWYASDPAKTIVLRDVPPEHHARVRRLVAQALREWREAPPVDTVHEVLEPGEVWSQGVPAE